MSRQKSEQKTSQRTEDSFNSLIARRHLFSTAHFYEQKRFSREENQRHFGACYTPHGHGHNYVIEAFVDGPVDPTTGLVMNVTDLDIVLKSACAPFDHHHINFDVPEFKDTIPTTENLAGYLFEKIKEGMAKLAPNLRLNRIRLFETDDIWAEVRPESTDRKSSSQSLGEPKVLVTKQVLVRAIHHLENPFLTPKDNQALYGICYGRHGHHYKVQVVCRGEIDEKSGLAIDRDELEEILERVIVRPYDGVDLNQHFTNTSCEAVAKEFFDLLQPELPKGALVKVGVQETRKNYFEFPPELA